MTRVTTIFEFFLTLMCSTVEIKKKGGIGWTLGPAKGEGHNARATLTIHVGTLIIS